MLESLYILEEKVNNVFTIDTEDWYHANYEDNLFSSEQNLKSTIESNIDKYLQIFDDYGVKGTFFVLGSVVEKHREMVLKIAKEGHEIASHGYGHQLVYKQSPLEFKEDVHKSKVLLEDAIGKKVIGYRAPSWSITDDTLWALDILEELDFKYNSAIFPTKNYLYGIPYAPRFTHDASFYGKDGLKILTVPPSTGKIFGHNIPFSGGAFFRLMPTWIIEYFTDKINSDEKQAVIFYLHPREIDPDQPRLMLKMKDAFIHYYGINQCENKLKQVLRRYHFVTMNALLGL